ncbi:MAG: S-layer homology domain-containing protein [Candidatus Microthrix sp.]|nr:S-layer homology domain-containing protein [Candidatus Microthrix sp.]
MTMSQSRIWVSMMLLLGIAALGLGVPGGRIPLGDASCFSPAPHGFSDVPTTYFANTAIAWLVEAGITTGTTPTTFSPNNKVTRAEMAAPLAHPHPPPPPPQLTRAHHRLATTATPQAGITTGTHTHHLPPTTRSPAPKWPSSSGATPAHSPALISASSPRSPETALEVLLTTPAPTPNSPTRQGWRSPPTAPSMSPTTTTIGSGPSTPPPVPSPPSPEAAPPGSPTAPATPPSSTTRSG